MIQLIEQNNQQMVSAKALHSFLEIETRFNDWIRRMFEYGFTENQDFELVTQKRVTNNPRNPETTFTDYALTFDMAKEISMIQRTPKGKRARQYFIEVEKKYRALPVALTPAEQLLNQAQVLIEQERKMNEIVSKQKELEDKISDIDLRTAHRPGFYSIQGYARLHNFSIPVLKAAELGRKALKMSNNEDVRVEEMPDPRFGKVNLYAMSILKHVFEAAGYVVEVVPEKPRGFLANIQEGARRNVSKPPWITD